MKFKKKYFLTVFILFLLSNFISAQILFNTNLYNSIEDILMSIQQDENKNYISLGWTNSFDGFAGYEFYLVKMNPKGEHLWSKTYGTMNSDKGRALLIDSNGDYILTGETKEVGGNKKDFLVIKTNSDGNMIWSKTYGTIGGNDIVYDIKECNDGSYIMCGYIDRNSGKEAYIIKINANGDIIWAKSFIGWNFVAHKMYIYDNDDVVVVGTRNNSQSALFFKLDKHGELIWDKSGYSYNYNVKSIKSVILNSSGKIVMVGFGFSDKHSVLLMVANSSGNVEWYKNYTMLEGFVGYNIEQTNDLGYIITGITRSSSFSNSGGTLVFKTDPNGNVIWRKRYPYYIDCPECGNVDLISTDDGAVFVTSNRFEKSNIIKFDTTDSQLDCLLFGNTINTISGSTYTYQNVVNSQLNDCLSLPISIVSKNVVSNLDISCINCPTTEAIFSYNEVGLAEFNFVNMSLLSDSYYWDFGDGNISTTKDPTHIYLQNGTYQVSLISTNPCGSDTMTQTLSILDLQTNVIDEKDDSDFIIFPNPSLGEFNLKFSSNEPQTYIINIYTILGEIIFSKKIIKTNGNNEKIIDLRTLSAGIYILQLETDQDVHSRCIVIK